MGDVRDLKTCLFRSRISCLFERETPFFFFDVETSLADLAGTVLSEGRYIQINEKSFEFLTKGGVAGSEKRVHWYQLLKRALPKHPHFIITAYTSVCNLAECVLQNATFFVTILPVCTLHMVL